VWFVIAVFSSVIFGLSGIVMKWAQSRQVSYHHFLFGMYASGALGFLLNSLLEHSLMLTDLRIWAAGLVIGAGSAWGNYIFLKAMEYGPASLTSPLVNMNFALIVLLGTVIYNEPLGLWEAAGIAAILFAIALISIRGKEPLSVREKTWYLFVALATVLFLVRNGGLKVTSEMGLENTPILFISYFIPILWFGLAMMRDRAKTAEQRPQSVRPAIVWGLIGGFGSYGGLQLYSIALQMGKANVVAPIFGTYSLVIAVGSILLFKEKLTRLQTYALISMFLGLVMVRL
jgi:drug/metabolite transporter (DMT)-like permease